jgi:hypothetical protein
MKNSNYIILCIYTVWGSVYREIGYLLPMLTKNDVNQLVKNDITQEQTKQHPTRK